MFKTLAILSLLGGSLAFTAPTANATNLPIARFAPIVTHSHNDNCEPVRIPRHLHRHRLHKHQGGQHHRHGPVVGHPHHQHRR